MRSWYQSPLTEIPGQLTLREPYATQGVPPNLHPEPKEEGIADTPGNLFSLSLPSSPSLPSSFYSQPWLHRLSNSAKGRHRVLSCYLVLRVLGPVCSPIRDPECSPWVYLYIFNSKKAGTFLFSALKLPLLISSALEGEGEAAALIKESG